MTTQMYPALGPGAIGIKNLALPEAIALASRTGFPGLVFDIKEATALAEAEGLDTLRARFRDAGVTAASWSVPGAVARDETNPEDLAALPRYLEVALALDCPRATTFLPPGSNERAMAENFAWTVERTKPFAAALAERGCWLGIEFCGPKTFRDQFTHEFLYTIGGVLELGDAIGTGNIGVLLDAFHLYTSGDDLAAIDQLTLDQIVMVHVNDAVAGVARDDQQDLTRMLPVTTGVLDLAGFMAKLIAKGYTGGVMAEPFHQPLNDQAATDPDGAARATLASIADLWRLAGLPVTF